MPVKVDQHYFLRFYEGGDKVGFPEVTMHQLFIVGPVAKQLRFMAFVGTEGMKFGTILASKLDHNEAVTASYIRTDFHSSSLVLSRLGMPPSEFGIRDRHSRWATLVSSRICGRVLSVSGGDGRFKIRDPSLRILDQSTQAAQNARNSVGLAELSPEGKRVESIGMRATSLGLSRMTRA
ncbi:hypothetical protein BC827DRAFT_1194292 [Russula dissimulans]|nr:hypothetical protein BC827DRAFT_1194292 [Russula dissimulans]